MDPQSFIARAEAQRWLGIAEKLLMGHDLVGSKTFAIRARESDPRLEGADQILAIADTLLAAEKRVVGSNGTQQPDFYAILQLVRFVQDTEHIAAQYRRLAVTLNPHQNRFPYSDQAFQLVNDAWAVLSNPMRKSMYDEELDFPQQQQMNHIGFNLEQDYHHHQQQHQHKFFSINRIGSGHEQELGEQQQTFQTRVQRSHQQQQLQQHNFLSQPHPVRPSPVREQEQYFQQREQEELFQPPVQPFQVTSTPQQQSRLPPQPPQPRQPMRSPTPPPPAVPPQPPVSWPQASPRSQPHHPQPQPSTRSSTPSSPAAPSQTPVSWPHAPQYSHQQPPMRSTTPPPTTAPPQPAVSWPQAPPHSQPQPPIRLTTPPPPAAPSQPPVSWPQAPPHSQPQPPHQQPQSQPQQQPHLPSPPPPPPQPQPKLQPQQKPQQEQQHQQQESPEQNSTPVQPPSQVDTNNVVCEEESERATDADSENVDTSPTFWTACPYCLYMYEYPRIYADCTLRCHNCERAFQAVPVPSPPPITEDQETYFCCWGSFPLGLSISHLNKNKSQGTNKNWTPFSPIHDVSSQIHDHLNNNSSPKKTSNWGPQIYIDDVTDDIFTGISEQTEPSDDSDADWNGTNNTKVKKTKKRGRKRKSKILTRKKRNSNLENNDSVGTTSVPLAESSKKGLVGNPRRQSGRVGKELGKLDLNVEFNNNEGEEPSTKNRGQKGEDDNIEGNGFFEGLDEFLSSLPILSVVNEEKVKAG